MGDKPLPKPAPVPCTPRIGDAVQPRVQQRLIDRRLNE